MVADVPVVCPLVPQPGLADSPPEGCFYLVHRGRRFPCVQQGHVVAGLESNGDG